jgi:hypothetical protein
VLCYSSVLPTLVLGVLTILHTLQMWPPYLVKDKFSPMGLAIGFYQPKHRKSHGTHVPLAPPISVAMMALSD